MPDITCTVCGKIKNVKCKNALAIGTKPNLEYLYDAMGNRITKIVKPAGSTSLDWVYTHYVRDAQGNVMATYKKENINQATSYQLTERHIYGSSRVGIDNKAIELIGYTAPSDDLYRHQIGLKNYELTNHLGNVNAVITDRKIPRSTNGLNIDYYMPDIVSATDYYAFGAPMPGRSFSGEKYRFGFNGKENDAESNTQDYGMRIYDTRLGRFLSVDPLTGKYPFYTPYQFAGNMPIKYVDLDGCEPADPPTKEKQYAVAAETGTENYFGWTGKKGDNGLFWDKGSSTSFTVPNNPNGDQTAMNKTRNKGEDNFAMTLIGKMPIAAIKKDFSHNFRIGTRANHKLGDFILDKYVNGIGLYESFDSESPLAQYLLKNSTFLAFKTELESQLLSYYNSTGTLEGVNLKEFARNIKKNTGATNFGVGLLSGTNFNTDLFLNAVIGGYQSMDIVIKQVDSKSISLQYTANDIFGASVGDSKRYATPGLQCMYYLQHIYDSRNYQPFPFSVTVGK